MSTIRDLQASVAAIVAETSTALQTLTDALGTGTATTAQIRSGVAALVQARADIRAFRASLDLVNMEAAQLYDDAAVTLALWSWGCSARWMLASLDARITTAAALGLEVLQGRAQTVHVVRLGETLQSIAATYLGSWSSWPAIAAANGLGTSQPAVGAVLVIPQAA